MPTNRTLSILYTKDRKVFFKRYFYCTSKSYFWWTYTCPFWWVNWYFCIGSLVAFLLGLKPELAELLPLLYGFSEIHL